PLHTLRSLAVATPHDQPREPGQPLDVLPHALQGFAQRLPVTHSSSFGGHTTVREPLAQRSIPRASVNTRCDSSTPCSQSTTRSSLPPSSSRDRSQSRASLMASSYSGMYSGMYVASS